VPDDLESGAYALRLRAAGVEDDVPFFVRPAPRHRPTPVALLVPTATYLAYANQQPVFNLAHLQASAFHTPVLGDADLFLGAHPEYGLSTYDTHIDGSGNFYSTRLRPILNMRPNYLNQGSLWGLPADLCLVGWLERSAYQTHFFTDEDLHHGGVELLRPYRVVLTGSHPEYASRAMLDALEQYVDYGGRLMYLGGNGFYWVISFHPLKPHLMEVRKQSGTRAWQAAPGEYYHSTTGELGGLWRHRGRPPQKLVGVGFSAQGFDSSSPYARLPDSLDPRAAFIFEGINREELIGDFGPQRGGAAGLELDRYERSLGTPPDALLVASSQGHTDGYLRAVEEVEVMTPGLNGTQDPDVRADMVYFKTPSGGGVFATGSIAWCESLPINRYDNNVARITGNVLGTFIKDERLP
jgi:N,N-dimethylformamidase